MSSHTWTVYLGGEIHSDWRAQVAAAARELPIDGSRP